MFKRTKKILDKSAQCGKPINERMIKRHIKKFENEVFKKGDLVLVRLGGS